MRRVLWLLILFLAGNCLPLSAQSNTAPANLKELRERLTAQVSAPKFAAAAWGIQVVSLDSQTVVFEHNPQVLLSPASNSKLYTVALGLDRLGSDYRMRTSLLARNRPDKKGKIRGDLIVYGRGDPTFNARFRGTLDQAFDPLAASLAAAGVRRITGALIGDASYFRGPPFGAGWAWDDTQEYYGAEISPLSVNDNYLDIEIRPGAAFGKPCLVTLKPPTESVVISNRTTTAVAGQRRNVRIYRIPGSNVVFISGEMAQSDPVYQTEITVHNPAALFVEFFRKALVRHRIKVGGPSLTRDWLTVGEPDLGLPRNRPGQPGSGWVEIGGVDSPPMSEIAREVQKPSQNLYTDLVLANVGEHARGEQQGNSESLGIRELYQFLQQVGVHSGDVQFEEGSGLSRNNLTTARATVRLLTYMSQHPASEAYIAALPVAGVDGTLRNRFKNTAAAGNLRAKTGTLRWASSLSGYMKTAAGERLVFSLMLNRYVSPDASPARVELDKLALLLANFTGRTAETASANQP
jgi:D-alanyl-D-alanine carboxypeptidase/D-alanyl-D-alanine-endopeptidase (penicillin-binding protein 4)